MDISKVGPNFYDAPFDLIKEDQGRKDIELTEHSQEEALQPEKEEESLDEKDEENPYDLDLKIKEALSYHYGMDPGLSGVNCGPQSEWPRCSRVCQTQRGHTCPSCDTQQRRQTCINNC